MKNEKGFTLIELLAIIVILAIIAVITVPIILGIVDDAKRGAAETSALGYIDAVQKQIAISQLGDSTTLIRDNTYNVSDLSTVIVNGTKPSDDSWVQVVNGEVANYSLKIGDYVINYDIENHENIITRTGNIAEKPSDTPPAIIYETYDNGTEIYFNPNEGIKCDTENYTNSNTGNNYGCMKWYTFNDDGENASTINLLLDHNTTATIAWNSSGNNADGMNQVKTALENNTSEWVVDARLITADEVAKIIGADSDETIKWSSAKTYGTDNIETNSSWIYLDGSGNTYSGWQQQTVYVQGTSSYWWLFDRTNTCTGYGCRTADGSNYGYWTSTPINGKSNAAWSIIRGDSLSWVNVNSTVDCGVRPVITISKSAISNNQ